MKRAITSFSGEYRFLSNFYPAKVVFENAEYPSAEHAYQAAKTLAPSMRRLIAAQETPGRAKRAGRNLPLRPLWDEIRIPTMEQILKSKFSDDTLAEKLLATGDALLVEGNTWGDRFWGAVYIGDKWVGKNWLGKLLMEVREELA